jgi:hypothetical protein
VESKKLISMKEKVEEGLHEDGEGRRAGTRNW